MKVYRDGVSQDADEFRHTAPSITGRVVGRFERAGTTLFLLDVGRGHGRICNATFGHLLQEHDLGELLASLPWEPVGDAEAAAVLDRARSFARYDALPDPTGRRQPREPEFDPQGRPLSKAHERPQQPGPRIEVSGPLRREDHFRSA